MEQSATLLWSKGSFSILDAFSIGKRFKVLNAAKVDSLFAKWKLLFEMEAASRKFVPKFSFEFLAAHFLKEI